MKSGFEIKWSKESRNDLQKIIEYLQRRWTDKEISKFFKKLEKQLEIIKKFPLTYPESTKLKGIRKCVLSPQT